MGLAALNLPCRYIGEMAEGVRHGHGHYTTVQKTRFEGEWRNNKKHGRFLVTESDGRKYEMELTAD